MSTYAGGKSLDAEVFIDLVNNKIEMDYSLNTKGNPMDSNRSAVIKNDIKQISDKNIRAKLNLKRFIYVVYLALYEMFASPIITHLTEWGWIKNKAWLIEHQKINKMLYLSGLGKIIETKEGPLFEPALVFWLSNNMWLQYFFEGDYEKQISAIQLKRHFKKRLVEDKYEIVRQDGWDLIFLFKSPPQSGSVRIEHT